MPECVQGLSGVVSEARYILVVEKDATFQKLVEAQVHRSFGPAVLITVRASDVCISCARVLCIPLFACEMRAECASSPR